MRAASYEHTGPAREVLRLVEVPDPVPGPGEVRVRLRWSGVNPSDVKTRAGLRGGPPFPSVIPHSDGMGAIDRVGAGVDASRIGERVWIWNGAWGRANGTAAEFITLPQTQAVPLPRGCGEDAAACFGIPALTALHAVLVDDGVRGKSVLVAGGAGAVGHYAIQFAKLLGARQVLTTVSSPSKAELARAAGADVVIDYRREDVLARVLDGTGGQGVDRIVEVDIGVNAEMNLGLTRPGGDWVAYGTSVQQLTLPFFALITRGIRVRFFMVYLLADEERSRAITWLHRWLAEGLVGHNIAARLPLSHIVQAHEWVEQGAVAGNVVLEIE